MPGSISQYVLKVCSRCDLACDHCYVYEHADQSWRAKPKIIAPGTVHQAARRIAEHARIHRLGEVHVVLHGGEPLLLGQVGLREVISTLRSQIDPVTRLDLRIHTNGVLLDEELCGLFADYAVQVGVSLDGDHTANDRHRRFSDGRSSYWHVRQALALLRKAEYRHLYAGILCTVDVRNDPIAVYEALLAEAPPRLDLLLPHATWDQPPPGQLGENRPYAWWLGQIHSRWIADGRPVPIRFFDSIFAAWEGRPSESEAAGLDAVDLLVIETDGSWEQIDSLKTAFDGAPATGLDIFSHSVDDAMAHPGVTARQDGISALCQDCQDCPLVRACGGGLYSHRFRSTTGFDNPSVYCDDLKELIPQLIDRPRQAEAKQLTQTEDSSGSHFLPAGAFDLLSAGPGDVMAMTSLTDSHWSVIRALVAQVASSLGSPASALGHAAADGLALLSVLDADRPQAVRDVLTYPYVQAWAVHCLSPATSSELDLAHLAGLAAAAAMHAGVEVEVVLPVRDGWIYLPSVGALAVDAGTDCTSVVHVSPTGLRSRHPIREWRTIRYLTTGDISISVEDTDPFRDCQAWVPTGRLSPATWKAWRRALAAAARQLATELPVYADVIGAGLRSVVPMRSAPAGQRRSGTAGHTFGALALALPDDVDMLSELLVHEMQHVKLAALCVLFDLFERNDAALFYAPWRDELRPLEGLLHGTYAHLAVADLWRSRARQRQDEEAHQLFLTYRSWVEESIEVLWDSGSLTSDGERFVKGMRGAVDAWADDG